MTTIKMITDADLERLREFPDIARNLSSEFEVSAGESLAHDKELESDKELIERVCNFIITYRHIATFTLVPGAGGYSNQ